MCFFMSRLPIKKESYDIIFSGWGASACILLIEMDKKNLLERKKVLLIDPETKNENDKTFCFWATEQDQIFKDYSKLISASWNSVQINNDSPDSILPLQYFHINSLDLYRHTREVISKYDVSFVKEYVLDIEGKDVFFVQTKDATYEGKYVFDSRQTKVKNPDKDRFYISQSFFGLNIELLEPIFNDQAYRMMDFRVPQSGSTQFVYVLPFTKTRGLVELTRFGKEILEISEAEVILNEFIENNFGAFKIIEKERGVIPMDPAFPPPNKKSNWISIGTRAGNVKPSTGYAFKNMYNQSRFLCRSDSFQFKRNLRKRRFHFYDQLLLIILTIWPGKGRSVFERLFKVQNTTFVLQFLDEKSKPSDEFKMFFNLQIGLFLKAVLFWINWKIKPYIISILMILSVLIPSESGFSGDLNISRFQVIILVVGLLLVGIPHGALDHFTNAIDREKRVTLKFIIRYLSLMGVVFLAWIWSPLFALVLFLIYSAWHFGQTDTKQWKVDSRIVGFLWGLILLSSLFITHLKEFNIILSALDVPVVSSFPKIMSWTYLMIGSGFAMSIYYRKLEWLLLICFLFFAQFTNLIFAFGIYFIFHHSRLGWLHLKRKLKVSHINMYTKALPFNIGAILLFILFFSNVELSLKENIAYFFIFLSCVSFPHVLCMDVFYGESE